MGVTVLVFEKKAFQKGYVLPLFAIDLYGETIKIETKNNYNSKTALFFSLFLTYVLGLM